MVRFIYAVILVSMFMFGVSTRAQTTLNFQIVFSSNRDTQDNWQLYAMNPDGSNIRRVLQSNGNDYGAVVSPDKQRLIFTRRTEQGINEVHALTLGEFESIKLADGSNPTWMSDGSVIAYTSIIEGNAEVYLMNPNGFDQRPLTDNPGRDFAPAWSPDGQWIAFKSDRDGEMGIYIIRPDKSDLQKITSTDANTESIAWSPGNREIIYTRTVDGKRGIYSINIETKETRKLSGDNTSDFSPVYTPNGQFVVFASVMIGQPDIYIMNSNGTERTRITNDPGWDWLPRIIAGATIP